MRLIPLLFVLLTHTVFAAAPEATGRRLKDIVADKYPKGNVWIGAAIGSPARIKADVEEELLRREFNYVIPENEFKQAMINPKAELWNWKPADDWMAYAKQHDFTMRLHCPIGPQVSKWAREDERTPEELAALLDRFMTELCDRYQAQPQVRWLDVVNETVDPKGEWFGPKPGPDGWENPWTIIGSDTDANKTPLYISRAFAIAAKHAPKVKLIYNQHTALEPASMEKVKQTILYLRKKGLRVDGLGWQGHLRYGWHKKTGNLAYLSELIAWCHANQLEFHITEMNQHLPKEPDANEEQETADAFAAIVKTLLLHRQTGVVAWNCWRMTDYTENGGRLGLLFNAEGAPKAAYYAVQKLLENPPKPITP